MNTVEAQPILVGVDGSLHSLQALKYARRVAESMRLPLKVVSVWHYRASGFGLPPIGMVPVPLDAEPEAQARKVLADAGFTVLSDMTTVPFETAVLEGETAEVLINESRSSEMLVVGSRGLGNVSAMLLGSVSAPCAQRAHCPVLVVHPQAVSSR